MVLRPVIGIWQNYKKVLGLQSQIITKKYHHRKTQTLK